MAQAEAAGADAKRPAPTPEEQERAGRLQALQLARSRALQDLQLACDRRHRALLEQTIEHLDQQIRGLG